MPVGNKRRSAFSCVFEPSVPISVQVFALNLLNFPDLVLMFGEKQLAETLWQHFRMVNLQIPFHLLCTQKNHFFLSCNEVNYMLKYCFSLFYTCLVEVKCYGKILFGIKSHKPLLVENKKEALLLRKLDKNI